jgi:hypothetical protein
MKTELKLAMFDAAIRAPTPQFMPNHEARRKAAAIARQKAKRAKKAKQRVS